MALECVYMYLMIMVRFSLWLDSKFRCDVLINCLDLITFINDHISIFSLTNIV